MQQHIGIFRPFDPDHPIEKTRRKLPHWTQPGASYFVTIRTWDSLPSTLIKALNIEKEAWLAHHPKPWSGHEKRYYYRQFHDQIERWLDAGYGRGHLKRPELAEIVEEALTRFDGDRYSLDKYVVMPTHFHAIVLPQTLTLGQILHSWNSYTSNKLNRELKRSGRFWMDESYDHLIRSTKSFRHFRDYIEQNPQKAHLRKGEYILGTGTGILLPKVEK